MKKSNIYTRTGDLGTTALVDGSRVKKNNIRVEAYGTVDELNSFIGLLCADSSLDEADKSFLFWIQNKLFDLGAYLATDNNGAMTEAPGFGQEAISKLEHEIDRLDNDLPQLRAFILPGGCTLAALAGVCRTVSRRAERQIITLQENNWVDPNVIRFVNRLSDYFFVLARAFNISRDAEEVVWQKDIK